MTWLPYPLLDRLLDACNAKGEAIRELLDEELEALNSARAAAAAAGVAPMQSDTADHEAAVAELSVQHEELFSARQALHSGMDTHLMVTRNTNASLSLALRYR